MAAPVCGLRAVRAFRCDVLKVPKPTNVIASPFFNDFVMPSISESTAAAAPAFEEPVSLAILAINSCLFMGSPWGASREGSNAHDAVVACGYTSHPITCQAEKETLLRGFALGEIFERLLERDIRSRCVGAEFNFRLLDF